MNGFSLLLAATAALSGSGPNVRIIGQERASGDPDDTNDDTPPSTHPDADPLGDITSAERARVRKLTGERERLLETMQALGFEDDGFYRRHDVLTSHGHRKAPKAEPLIKVALPPKKPHPLSLMRTEAAPKGPGKRTRAQRRADNARKLAAPKGSGKGE